MISVHTKWIEPTRERRDIKKKNWSKVRVGTALRRRKKKIIIGLVGYDYNNSNPRLYATINKT